VTTTTTRLLVNGRIYTPDSSDATAMAVTGGLITWIGQDSPGRAAHPDAELVDLDGAFVAPAFVDAHVHATATGLLHSGLDLTGVRSLADCLAAVRAARTNGLVWGHGWDETRWPEHRPPTRAELDEAAGGRAVYLSRIDVHSALASTALIDAAPAGRGALGWSDSGPLTRDAHHHIRGAALRAITPAQRKAAQLAFLDTVAAHCIAAVHECAGPDISGRDDLADLLALAAEPGRPEVVGYWGQIDAGDLGISVHGLAGDLFVDGALGSRTAFLHKPYADADTHGAAYLDAEQIAAHLIACTRAGIQAGFHAIGDAAVSAVVDGFTIADKTVGTPALAGRAHRIEHLEMITPAQADVLGRLGVVASAQPAFDAAWGGPDGMYAQRLGAERSAALNPFAVLAKAGMTLAFGSDSPVTPIDPWASVRAAVQHHTETSRISARAAFTAHTRGGWRAAGARDLSGVLTPGAPATYAIWQAGPLVKPAADNRVQRWSTDPRSGVPALPSLEPGAELPTCLATFLRGEPIYLGGRK
jgi:predicted amidohydrolase YtcJ